jgi:serine protease Do
VTRGWIGVQIQPVTREIADSLGMKNDEGAIVAEPQAGSPASKAGIKAGDVIVKVNGDAIKDARMLARRVSSLAPGTNAKLDVIRDGKEQQITLVIGDMPQGRRAEATGDEREPKAAPALGLALAPADKVSGAGEQGVVVTKVDPEGPAAERGFKVGDVILDVAGSKVGNPTEVRKAIADARSGGKKTILMRIKSGDQTRFVAVPVGTA